MRHVLKAATWALAALFCSAQITAASAETKEVRLGDQYGLGNLPLYVVTKEKLIEKHAAKAGLGDINVKLIRFSGASAVNDALLSGNVDFTIGGAGSLVLMWARTKGPQKVKAIASLAAAPMYLLTIDPKIHSLKDYGPGDKIGLPAAKVSMQAFALEMASQKLYGDPFKLDSLTVSLPHTEGMTALRSGRTEIKSYWTAIPFQNETLAADPNVRKVASSFDAFGGPHTHITMYGMQRFKDNNPKTFQAIADAFKEAFELIEKNPRRAAEIYIEHTHSKDTVDFIQGIMSQHEVSFVPKPQGMMRLAKFMHDAKIIPVLPESWKDMFFDNVHAFGGN